jgi:hypothetical protein
MSKRKNPLKTLAFLRVQISSSPPKEITEENAFFLGFSLVFSVFQAFCG